MKPGVRIVNNFQREVCVIGAIGITSRASKSQLCNESGLTLLNRRQCVSCVAINQICEIEERRLFAPGQDETLYEYVWFPESELSSTRRSSPDRLLEYATPARPASAATRATTMITDFRSTVSVIGGLLTGERFMIFRSFMCSEFER